MSRRISILSGFVLVTVIMLAGCQTRTVTTTESSLSVNGPVEAVERFARLQATRTPAVETTALKPTGPGTAEIEIVLGDTATGDDVVEIGRQAIEAGLNYSFTSAQTTATNIS